MNISIFNFLFSFAHQSPFLDKVIVFIAEPFGYIMILLAVLFLFIHKDEGFDYKKPLKGLVRKIKEIALVFSSGIFAFIISESVKYIYQAPRPFLYFKNVVPLFYHGGMDSFPSGHATFFSALAVSLYFCHPRIGKLFMIVAVMIGLARVTAGIHFPIDIIGGFILGPIIVLIFNLIFKPKKV